MSRSFTPQTRNKLRTDLFQSTQNTKEICGLFSLNHVCFEWEMLQNNNRITTNGLTKQ